MKKFVLVCTLIAALAAAGCGDNEPSKKASVPSSSSTAKQEVKVDTQIKNFKKSRDTVKVEQLEDGTIVETGKYGNQIITHPDGSKTYTSGKKSIKDDLNSDSKLGHFHK